MTKYQKFCHECGNSLSKNVKFCNKCGAKINVNGIVASNVKKVDKTATASDNTNNKTSIVGDKFTSFKKLILANKKIVLLTIIIVILISVVGSFAYSEWQKIDHKNQVKESEKNVKITDFSGSQSSSTYDDDTYSSCDVSGVVFGLKEYNGYSALVEYYDANKTLIGTSSEKIKKPENDYDSSFYSSLTLDNGTEVSYVLIKIVNLENKEILNQKFKVSPMNYL